MLDRAATRLPFEGGPRPSSWELGNNEPIWNFPGTVPLLTIYRIAGKFRGVKICSTREMVVFVSKNFRLVSWLHGIPTFR